ncbi:hypothetical protein [Yersinia pseudotuberculosis]|uniref:hypothetical protein n=1 Tax=Yersinia pseudotuberculosis TaxID=633 RepID=UPI0012D79C37|nr:hypothetical protein [Yersinia pseudotuberculosis]
MTEPVITEPVPLFRYLLFRDLLFRNLLFRDLLLQNNSAEFPAKVSYTAPLGLTVTGIGCINATRVI